MNVLDFGAGVPFQAHPSTGLTSGASVRSWWTSSGPGSGSGAAAALSPTEGAARAGRVHLVPLLSPYEPDSGSTSEPGLGSLPPPSRRPHFTRGRATVRLLPHV